jgi:hypothetical protein
VTAHIIVNTAPVVSSVEILPSAATAFYNLTCHPLITTDVDPADLIFNYTYRYQSCQYPFQLCENNAYFVIDRWYVNGQLITNASNHRARGVTWNGDGGSPWALTSNTLPSYYLLKVTYVSPFPLCLAILISYLFGIV